MATITRERLNEIIANAPAGVDTTALVAKLAKDHKIEGRSPFQGTTESVLSGLGGPMSNALAYGAAGAEQVIPHIAGPLGTAVAAALIGKGLQGRSAAPPPLTGSFGAQSVSPPPSPVPAPPPAQPPGNFGGQPLSTAPSVSQSFATETPALSRPLPEPVPFTPSRSISVAGKPKARAPLPTEEPKYTGGRGASGPELARREAARATATGKKVPLGKTGEVIGEIGDEARTAGRHSDSLEDLLKRSLEIARKVPPEARQAVFKTVKAASKFAHEADTALGGQAMLFFDLLPQSTVQEIMNTRFTVDPKTGQVVKRQLATGA